MQGNTLFSRSAPSPLANLLRPKKLEDIVGQPHLTSPDAPLALKLKAGRITATLLHGPAGCGKTSLARAMAGSSGMIIKAMSAVDEGTSVLSKILAEAKERLSSTGRQTLLFIDELGEWSKSQQKNLLPCTEDGSITLIGATTANIGFSIISPLLSRMTAYELRPLQQTDLNELIDRAAIHLRIKIDDEPRFNLINYAVGDGRSLLNIIEEHAIAYPGEDIRMEGFEKVIAGSTRRHDRAGDAHYALLSAMQKSIRGSDPDAAALYIGMLHQGGEPARNIFRRLLIMATEEVGLADPSVLNYVLTCAESYERVGEPEGLDLIMAAALRIATAPKSNATHMVKAKVAAFISDHHGLQPPKRIINAPTKQMIEAGFKENYIYDHDVPGSFSGQEFMPDKIVNNRPTFYEPKQSGSEVQIAERLIEQRLFRENLILKSNSLT